MRKSLNAVVAMLFIALFTTLSTAAFAAETHAAAPAPTGVVNINTADGAQLALLPRVGVKAAQRIIDYRKEHGAFKKTSDLMQVKGFGEKTFERLNPYLTTSGSTTLTEKVKSPRKPSRQSPTPKAS
jgi:competence protein ComEA